ncbi:MAG: 1,4-alpha-glucan branching enzyme, partial [Euzebyales bacterium]|nr:1,4-alpha-glucan branching enzyme [Euzebyales bacterium]
MARAPSSSQGEPAHPSTVSWKAPAAEVAALVGGEHRRPHRLLGVHTADGGCVVRAWRPDATGVRVLRDGAAPVQAQRTHDAGLFEAFVDTPVTAGDYRLAVTYA